MVITPEPTDLRPVVEDLRCEVAKLRGDRAAAGLDLARLDGTLRAVHEKTRRFIEADAALRATLARLAAQWEHEQADMPPGAVGAAAAAIVRLCAAELRAALSVDSERA
jgi:hypothetical protein